MNWFMVWGAALQAHPKWLALTLAQRGAWITLLTVASNLQPRWRFRSRNHAALILARDGAEHADALLDALLEQRLLDEDPDGALVVHNHERWQRYPSDTPEARAERSRRFRARHREAGVGDPHATSSNDGERAPNGREQISDERERLEETKETYHKKETYSTEPSTKAIPSDDTRLLAPVRRGSSP